MHRRLPALLAGAILLVSVSATGCSAQTSRAASGPASGVDAAFGARVRA